VEEDRSPRWARVVFPVVRWLCVEFHVLIKTRIDDLTIISSQVQFYAGPGPYKKFTLRYQLF